MFRIDTSIDIGMNKVIIVEVIYLMTFSYQRVLFENTQICGNGFCCSCGITSNHDDVDSSTMTGSNCFLHSQSGWINNACKSKIDKIVFCLFSS